MSPSQAGDISSPLSQPLQDVDGSFFLHPTAECPLHSQLIWSCRPSQSCVSFYHLWGLSHFPWGQWPFRPLLQQRGGRYVSALFAHVRHTAHCAATALKRPIFFPRFTATINAPWSSHAPLALIFLGPPPPFARSLLFIAWCRSRTTNQFQSLWQWGLTGPICLPRGQ